MDQDVELGVSNPRGRKSVPWRRDPIILARMRTVERLHLRGDTNVAIATSLDVDEITIRRDLDRLRELWVEATKEDQETLRAQIVAELDDTRHRALAAAEFDEAAERAVLYGDPIEDAKDGRRRSVYRDAKGSAQFRGNKAAAIAQARQATMDKAKVLGLIVDKVAPTNAAGDDIPLAELMERFAQRAGNADDS